MKTAEPTPLSSANAAELWKLRGLGMCAVIAFALYLNPGPFFRPELWAEDGAEFLAGPLIDGFWSCFRPVAFNFMLLPRFVAFMAVEFLPLRMTPAVFAWVPLLTTAFVLSSLVRDDMAWIHPDRRFRLALVFALGVVPALAEVTMALCNGTYVLGLAAFLLCLRDHPRFNFGGVSLMVILMLSSTITILVPVIWAWRALFEKSERAIHLKFLAASTLPFVLMLVSALLNPFAADSGLVYLHAPPAYGIAPFDIAVLADIFVSRLGILVVGVPILGHNLTTSLMKDSGLFWITPLLAPIVMFGFWRAQPRIVLGVLLGVALFPLMHLGRNYGAELSVTNGLVFPFQRWSLVAQVFVLIGYAAMASRVPVAGRWLVAIPLIQFSVVTFATPSHIALTWEEAPKKPFGEFAKVVEAQRNALRTGETRELLTPVIPVHPEYWAAFQIRLRP